MSTDLQGLQQALESDEVKDFLAKQERLTHSSLASLMDMISAQQKIKLVRGDTFQYNAGKKEMTYDEPLLLSLPPAAAPGLIWHNSGHATDSQPAHTNISSVVKDITRLTNGEIPEKSVFNILEAMEDERMEAIQRSKWRNLGNTFLPRIDQGWREPHYEKMEKEVQTPTPPGQTGEDGLPVFWDRVAKAVRGIESGAMDIKDLPPDIQWDQQLVDQIKQLRNCTTVDDLLNDSKAVIQQVVQQSLKQPPSSGQQPPGNGNGGQGQGNGQPSGGGQPGGQPGGQGNQPGNKPSQQPGNGSPNGGQRKENTVGQQQYDPVTGQSSHDVPQSFVNGGEKAGFEHGQIDRTYHGPPWSVVLKTVDGVIGPIRTQIRRYLKDNEMEDTDSGFTSGYKVNKRALTSALVSRHNKLFNRPVVNSQKSYAILFVVDCSGSMSGSYSSYNGEAKLLDPWLKKCGDAGYSRIALAMRMCVAMISVLDKFKEVKTAVGFFEGHCKVVKPFSKRWDETERQKVMDILQSRGGTVVDGILEAAPKEFAKIKADKKLCIILSDGDLGSRYLTENQVRQKVKELQVKHGIEFACLTVGCPDTTAKAYFGNERSDVITEATVGNALGKHLKRMVKPRG